MESLAAPPKKIHRNYLESYAKPKFGLNIVNMEFLRKPSYLFQPKIHHDDLSYTLEENLYMLKEFYNA